MKTVSRSALVSRIQRRLAHEGERMRVVPGGVLGNSYCIIDAAGAEVCRGDDLAELARDVGVLRTNETLAV